MDEFEQRLGSQQLREAPAGWRAEILSAARSALRPAPRAPSPGFLPTLIHQLSTVLWPHPKAWAGLAAVWIVIMVLNFSTHDTATVVAVSKTSAPSPEIILQLRRQQRLLAQLIGPREVLDADRSKYWMPRPRSEALTILSA